MEHERPQASEPQTTPVGDVAPPTSPVPAPPPRPSTTRRVVTIYEDVRPQPFYPGAVIVKQPQALRTTGRKREYDYSDKPTTIAHVRRVVQHDNFGNVTSEALLPGKGEGDAFGH